MTITTRKPTGRVAFPFLLLTGEAGSGKTWSAVEASGMEEVGSAWFIEIGEGQADEYGAVPGADFEIIEHDGSLGQIREAIRWAAEQPSAEGKYNLLVIDSMTELWNLIKGEAQVAANKRRKGRKNEDGDYSIAMDLWNRAGDTWNGIIRQIKAFPGPVIGTARLTITAVVDGEGRPTGGKMWKIDSQKNLPFQAAVVVQAREPRVWTMTKIATTVPKLQLKPGKETTFKDFSVATLLREMGVTADTQVSNFAAATSDGSLTDEAEAAREQEAVKAQQAAQRADWIRTQQTKLLDLERAGDIQTLTQGRDWYAQRGEAELAQQAATIIERLQAAAAQWGMGDQTVYDAEVLPA